MKDVRFRNHLRLSLFANLFIPVSVGPAIWLAHKLTTVFGFAESFVIACVFGVSSAWAYNVAGRVFLVEQRNTSRIMPPSNAEFLFYLFMTAQNCDALVGDLVERYKLIHKKFGRRRANFWYWTQTVMSLGPIVWAWAKKVGMKPVVALVGWAVARGLIGHDGWLTALMELWKRMKT